MRLGGLVLALLTFSETAAAAQDFVGTDFFAAREVADPAAADVAAGMAMLGDSFGKDSKWSSAFKAYAEAALVFPSAETLGQSAGALARISRSDDSCANGHAGKLSDLSDAFRLLASAARIAEAYGEPPAPAEAIEAVAAQATATRDAVAACQ